MVVSRHLSLEVATRSTLCCDMLPGQGAVMAVQESTEAFACGVESVCDADCASAPAALDPRFCTAGVVSPYLAPTQQSALQPQSCHHHRLGGVIMVPVTRVEKRDQHQQDVTFLKHVHNMDSVWPAGARTHIWRGALPVL